MFALRKPARLASRHSARQLACEQRSSVMALAHWQEPRTKFRAVATDYDGTLARNGKVQPETLRALFRVRLSGRRVILVTGPEISSLKEVMPQLEVLDLIVAENGAVLLWFTIIQGCLAEIKPWFISQPWNFGRVSPEPANCRSLFVERRHFSFFFSKREATILQDSSYAARS